MSATRGLDASHPHLAQLRVISREGGGDTWLPDALASWEEPQNSLPWESFILLEMILFWTPDARELNPVQESSWARPGRRRGPLRMYLQKLCCLCEITEPGPQAGAPLCTAAMKHPRAMGGTETAAPVLILGYATAQQTTLLVTWCAPGAGLVVHTAFLAFPATLQGDDL